MTGPDPVSPAEKIGRFVVIHYETTTPEYLPLFFQNNISVRVGMAKLSTDCQKMPHCDIFC